MDDYSPDAFVNRDDPIPTIILNKSTPGSRTPSSTAANSQQQQQPTGHDSEQSDAETPQGSRRKHGGLRGRFSALKEKARLQDQLVEKLLAQVVPTDDDMAGESPYDETPSPQKKNGGSGGGGASPGTTEKPNFNLTTMSNNFRRFNARIGVVFVFQARAIRVLSWKKPTHTLSFLAVYTFVCLDPYLLPLLPLAILLIGVLVPSFIARHPAAEYGNPSDEQQQQALLMMPYSPHGPPLAPPMTVRPAKELSRDFFRNMRDLQNCMEDFSQLHDAVVSIMLPRTNFSDEALSSALFVALVAACLFMSIAANAVPWRLVFLALGWGLTCSGHPAVQRQLQAAHERHVQPQEEKALGWIDRWVERDVILDSAPETREVEVFELQRLSGDGGEWESWLFTPSPYDPMSPARIAGERPTGTRFFEDVLPPQGWEWSEKKWALDLWSREWVEERIITGVEIETEGERWVYDIYDERANRVGMADDAATATASAATPSADKGREKRPSWEEGDDWEGRRGEWRRRRWVRLVKRKNISRDAVA
ncbi:integral peroxisomal membrane peroxin-domain-containing protein [Biscogniauxia mediterranea]|nr:integral peroxisomal membrane peroxin-domain-containing protein [Biscogniauxia mediterranea]